MSPTLTRRSLHGCLTELRNYFVLQTAKMLYFPSVTSVSRDLSILPFFYEGSTLDHESERFGIADDQSGMNAR